MKLKSAIKNFYHNYGTVMIVIIADWNSCVINLYSCYSRVVYLPLQVIHALITTNSFIVEVQYNLILSWPAFLWGTVYKYEVKVQCGKKDCFMDL